MNYHVLSWLLFFLAPGGCPIYSIKVSTQEVPTSDLQNELTLQTMLSTELRQFSDSLSLSRTAISAKVDWLPMLTKALPQASRGSIAADTFLGTNLFESRRKSCFSLEEMALMSARRTFEQLVPKSYPRCLLSDCIVRMLVRYVNKVNQIVQEMSDENTRRLPQRALYDALGGYFRHYLVPAAQVSYYAGRLKLSTVQRLVNLKRQCYIVLNTNGNAWRAPAQNIMWQFKGAKIEPIELRDPKFEDGAFSCGQLDQSSVAQESDQGQMIVPLPQLEPADSEGHLSNIFLPFRKRRIYNLRSPCSASVLIRFFKTVTSCHRFQEKSQASYNHKLLIWIRENVHSHYRDEMFYPGLGGILQIQETLLHLMKGQKGGQEDYKANRSISDWQEELEHGVREPKQDEELAVQEEVTSSEQEHELCRDCSSYESLIWYIAAFLALLLLIILLIICLCMRRAKKRKDKKPSVPADVEAPPPSTKPPAEKPKRSKPPADEPKRSKKSRDPSKPSKPYYGKSAMSPQDDVETSSLNCHLHKKCLPAKFSGPKKTNSYYRIVSEESSSQRQLVPSTISEMEDSKKKRKRHSDSKEAKRKERKAGETGRSKSIKSSGDKTTSSPQERGKSQRVRIVETDDSSFDPRELRKKPHKTETPKTARLTGGTASTPQSVKDSPSWETTFEDI